MQTHHNESQALLRPGPASDTMDPNDISAPNGTNMSFAEAFYTVFCGHGGSLGHSCGSRPNPHDAGQACPAKTGTRPGSIMDSSTGKIVI